MSWELLVADAPDLASRVQARFAANRHHVIGTIRPDGAPRLSGIEVEIDGTHVRVGMMPGSRKLADVERDPRVEVHSAPLEDDLADGDAKLAGRLVFAGPTEGVPGSAFTLDLSLVSIVRVDGDFLDLTIWRPGTGARTVRRR